MALQALKHNFIWMFRCSLCSTYLSVSLYPVYFDH